MSNNATESVVYLPLREYFIIPIEVTLFAFHLSVFAFIATRVVQANASYSNPFLKLYLVQCISNYMCFVTVRFGRAQTLRRTPH